MMVSGTRQGGNQLCSRWGLLAIVATGLVFGCSDGGDHKPTAKVTGKVTYDGNPVPGGALTFSPIRDATSNKPGKGGQAVIKPDGTYTVTTYTDGDGAVVGKHQVVFSPPAPAAAAPQAPGGAHVESAAPVSPYAGLAPKQVEISVAKGENKIDIELVKQGAPGN